jgi:hypothetical protein
LQLKNAKKNTIARLTPNLVTLVLIIVFTTNLKLLLKPHLSFMKLINSESISPPMVVHKVLLRCSETISDFCEIIFFRNFLTHDCPSLLVLRSTLVNKGMLSQFWKEKGTFRKKFVLWATAQLFWAASNKWFFWRSHQSKFQYLLIN